MTKTFRRVALSVDEPDPISMPAPRGINKGRLILWVTAGAAVLSVASAILGFYKWHEGEEALARASTTKADAETAKLQVDRRISDIDAKYADNWKRLELLLTQRDADLRVQQLRTEITAQRKNTEEAEVAAARKEVEKVNAAVAIRVVQPLIPLLHESTICTGKRGQENCGLESLIPPPQALSLGYPPPYRTQSSDGPVDAYGVPAPAASDPYSARAARLNR